MVLARPARQVGYPTQTGCRERAVGCGLGWPGRRGAGGALLRRSCLRCLGARGRPVATVSLTLACGLVSAGGGGSYARPGGTPPFCVRCCRPGGSRTLDPSRFLWLASVVVALSPRLWLVARPAIRSFITMGGAEGATQLPLWAASAGCSSVRGGLGRCGGLVSRGEGGIGGYARGWLQPDGDVVWPIADAHGAVRCLVRVWCCRAFPVLWRYTVLVCAWEYAGFHAGAAAEVVTCLGREPRVL
ncbi:hypothetical protein FGB62_567g00 [Gracilaria domingensis]|nr:hypothetical protein FGB62_567g00 [Gracilaria domingensis]